MRRQVRVLGLCTAFVGITLAGATSAAAANTTASVAKPAGYSIVNGAFALPPGQTPANLTCPKKKGVQTVPLDGGALITSNSLLGNINSSFPTPTGWHVDINNSGATALSFTAYVVCAKKLPGYAQHESASVDNPAGATTAAGYICPKGDVVLGGGVLSSSTSTLVNLNSSWPAGTTTWYNYMNNASTSDASETLFRVCAKLNVTTTHYQEIVGTVTVNPAGHQTSASAFCPGGLSTLGGGLVSSSADGANVTLNTTFPFTGGWTGDENNASGSNYNITVYVLCGS
jgi:hypothetical protein